MGVSSNLVHTKTRETMANAVINKLGRSKEDPRHVFGHRFHGCEGGRTTVDQQQQLLHFSSSSHIINIKADEYQSHITNKRVHHNVHQGAREISHQEHRGSSRRLCTGYESYRG